MKKEYYRLSELSRNTQVHLEDFEYVIENYKETLFFRVHAEKVLIIEPKLSDFNFPDNNSLDELQKVANSLGSNEQEYIGTAVGIYTGLVRLSNEDKDRLLNSGTVSVSNVLLDDTSGLKRIQVEYPFNSELPNDIIVKWEGNNEVDKFGVNAIIVAPQTLSIQLKAKEVTLNDILVPDFQVESIKHLLMEPIKEEAEKTCSKSTSRTSDLHDLISKIIINTPSTSAKGVWKVLEEESRIDEGDREFDQYNILRDVSATEVYWESRYGNSGTLKFSSINTIVSKIKKSLFST